MHLLLVGIAALVVVRLVFNLMEVVSLWQMPG